MLSCFKCNNNSIIDVNKSINDIKISKNLHKIFLKNIKDNNNCFNIDIYNPKNIMNSNTAKLYKITVCNNNYTCKKYIIKGKDESEIKLIKREIKNLKHLTKHPSKYLPYLCASIENNKHIYIFYDYINGIDLFELVKNNYSIIKKNHNLLDIIYNILMALHELFKANLAHLDLKPENIIVNNFSPIRLKLVDFECAHDIRKTQLIRPVGTIGYSSPEITLHNRYYYNSDIWSLGCIIYFLMTKKELFHCKNIDIFVRQLSVFKCIDHLDKKKYHFDIFSDEMYDLIKKMLSSCHYTRISITNILKSNLMKTYLKLK